jgi:hypothetical protein
MGATVIAASCRLASLRLDGWVVSPQGVERIWRQETLKIAQKQPQRDGLWLAPGPGVSLWLCGPKQARSYDFAMKYKYWPYGEISHTPKEVQILIKPWRWDYNKVRPTVFWGIDHRHPEPTPWPPEILICLPATRYIFL